MVRLTKKLLEEGSLKFLIASDDTALIDDFINQFRPFYPERKIIRCRDIETFLEKITTDNLFSTQKNILVLTDLNKENVNEAEYACTLESSAILVFVQSSSIPKLKAYTSLKSICTPIEFKKPTSTDCIAFIKGKCNEIGVTVKDGALSKIVEVIGPDFGKLLGEVKKIAYLAKARDGVVDVALCEKVLISDPEVQYFDFMNDFFKKRVKECIKTLKKIDPYTYIKLLHFMIGQVERTYKVAILKESKKSDDDIAEIIGIPKFIIKTKFYPALTFFGKSKLLLLMDLFNRLDIELRVSKLPKNLLLESYMLKAFKL